MPPTTLGSRASGYTVYWAPLNGDPNAGVSAWGAWQAAAWLAPQRTIEAMAPRFNKATLELDIASLRLHAWQWASRIRADDRVKIVSASGTPIFLGWIADIDWGFGQASEQVIVTCVSAGYRLTRDLAYLVHGRWMVDQKDPKTMRLCTGLPCVFNADGRPNKLPAASQIDGHPAFTIDNGPGAEYWKLGDVIEYLQERYNSARTWIDNATITQAMRDSTARMVLDIEGRPLWQALSDAADAAGYGVWESLGVGGGGEAAAAIEIEPKTGGTQRSVKHQAPDADTGQFPTLDLAATNLFAASVAENVSGCLTRPTVAGGRDLWEITVELGKAWDSDRLEIAESGDYIVPPGYEEKRAGLQYVKRYCVGGANHDEYADVGRLWVANEDGQFSGNPWVLAVADLAAAAGQEALSWPLMRCPALPTLTGIAYDAENGFRYGTVVEVTIDDGSSWHTLEADGYEVLRDRLGIRLTAKNLASVHWSAGYDGVNNLFYKLWQAPSDVRLRITCTIAGPDRVIGRPAQSAAAGTKFETSAYYDRGTLGQLRRRASGSKWYGSDFWADTNTSTAEADNAAAAIADAWRDRQIEAGLMFEWPDEPIALNDQITGIDGIAVSFAINAGAAARYPRVVQITRLLTPETWGMQVALDTDRKSILR